MYSMLYLQTVILNIDLKYWKIMSICHPSVKAILRFYFVLLRFYVTEMLLFL